MHLSAKPLRRIIYNGLSEFSCVACKMRHTIANIPWYTLENERCSEL